jgi:hypothetical protein
MTRFMLSAAAVFICSAVILPDAFAADDPVARGKYIVSTSGCHDCHTPWVLGPKGPEPDIRARCRATPPT